MVVVVRVGKRTSRLELWDNLTFVRVRIHRRADSSKSQEKQPSERGKFGKVWCGMDQIAVNRNKRNVSPSPVDGHR